MLFSIICVDKADSLDTRLANREAHLEHLSELDKQNRLTLAGPTCADETQQFFNGSIIIASFDTLEHALKWAAEDPYAKAGLFESVRVQPFKLVIPK